MHVMYIEIIIFYTTFLLLIISVFSKCYHTSFSSKVYKFVVENKVMGRKQLFLCKPGELPQKVADSFGIKDLSLWLYVDELQEYAEFNALFLSENAINKIQARPSYKVDNRLTEGAAAADKIEVGFTAAAAGDLKTPASCSPSVTQTTLK